MKKVIRLSESDLERIIKQVIRTKKLNEDFGNTKENKQNKKNINPKNLKLGAGGRKNPQQVKDVNALQQELINLGLLKTDTGKPTGYFGSKTQSALDTYNGKSNPVEQKTAGNTKTTQSSGFIILFAFPDYQPAVQDNWMNRYVVAPITKGIFGDDPKSSSKSGGGGSSSAGSPKGDQIKIGKVGHGGCIIVDINGNCMLYEFGRYTNNDTGVVRSDNLGKIGVIKDGKLMNAKDIAQKAKKYTEGDGPRLSMDCSVLSLPNTAAAHEFAKVKEREYSTYDASSGGGMNCGTYSLEVAIKGGANTSFKCFATPVGVIEHVKPISLGSFTV
jgi:hypothetical protein